jgi:hypothetical protein
MKTWLRVSALLVHANRDGKKTLASALFQPLHPLRGRLLRLQAKQTLSSAFASLGTKRCSRAAQPRSRIVSHVP